MLMLAIGLGGTVGGLIGAIYYWLGGRRDARRRYEMFGPIWRNGKWVKD